MADPDLLAAFCKNLSQYIEDLERPREDGLSHSDIEEGAAGVLAIIRDGLCGYKGDPELWLREGMNRVRSRVARRAYFKSLEIWNDTKRAIWRGGRGDDS